MANTQTSVPVFTAGQVLTAQQQTEINTGIPVFATTVTRDAAFGGAGEKALAEGQFAYIEATNATQYYDGAAWQAVDAPSGLTLISATTIGTTVTSVTVTGAFSATYDNYLITVNGGIASTTVSLNLVLGATATGYYAFDIYGSYTSNTVNGFASANVVRWVTGVGTANNLDMQVVLKNPFLAKTTGMLADSAIHATSGDNWSRAVGFLNDTTSYTAFTIGRNTGTLTGGTIRVYGLANS